MYFFIDTKVQHYDCDATGRLKLSSAMRYMEQASSEQLRDNGFATDQLLEEDMVFLLSKMNILVHRMPESDEGLHIGTAATDPRGVRFQREFVVDSRAGERLISATSSWVLFSPGARQIIRPANFPYDMRFQEQGLAGVVDDIPFPKQPPLEERTDRVPIRYSHIDVNRHVNNTMYADFASDLLPYQELTERGIQRFAINFQNETQWGDTVALAAQQTQPGTFYVRGSHDRGICFEALTVLGRAE